MANGSEPRLLAGPVEPADDLVPRRHVPRRDEFAEQFTTRVLRLLCIVPLLRIALVVAALVLHRDGCGLVLRLLLGRLRVLVGVGGLGTRGGRGLRGLPRAALA